MNAKVPTSAGIGRGRRFAVLILVMVAVAGPLQAELTADGLSSQLLATRDQIAKELADWHIAVKAKTDGDFEAVKAELADTWTKGRQDAVTAAASALDQQRQAITDQLAGDPERLDRVSRKLKQLFDARVTALEEAGETFDAAAAAFVPPITGDAKQQALDTLAELTSAALAPISDAEWGKLFESASAAFAEPTAADTAVAQQAADEAATKSVQSWVNAVERDFARIVHCDYEETTNSLVCDKALAVSGAEISSIDVRGLPSQKTVTVTASTAREGVLRSGDGDPEYDTLTLAAPHSDQVQVAIYMPRGMRPTYQRELAAYEKTFGDGGRSEAEMAAEALRYPRSGSPSSWREAGGGKEPASLLHQNLSDLALVVSGKAPMVRITVAVGGQEAGAETKVVTAALELGYARWGVDTGGFFALRRLADEKLETAPGSKPNTVRIARLGGGSDWTQDTGVFLNLVPKNYPYLGIGIGFSANEDQPNTFYLGPSLRLLSFRNRGVASFSIGVTASSVKRFPGLKQGADDIPADDPRLEGTSQIELGWYGVVQLGFSFGRIPGANDGE